MPDFLNAIVDTSHHNGNVNFDKAKADGIQAVIQKATQGLLNIDPTYKTNKAKATKAGLLWGAYHFGTGGDGVAQAERFLSVVGTDANTLHVLDFEPNNTGATMSLTDAHGFVTHVAEKTGRFPGLYSGHLVKEMLGARRDALLAKCWLWLAQYGPTAVVQATWDHWTMWQYTDGAIGNEPHSVAGIGRCDRDRFNGTAADLNKFWPSGG